MYGWRVRSIRNPDLDTLESSPMIVDLPLFSGRVRTFAICWVTGALRKEYGNHARCVDSILLIAPVQVV